MKYSFITAYGGVLKQAHCGPCQSTYRFAVALSHDAEIGWAWRGRSERARANARREATEALRLKLDTDTGFVPCPSCGEYPAEMIEWHASRQRTKAKSLAFGLFVLFGGALLLSVCVHYDVELPISYWEQRKKDPPAIYLRGAIVALAAAIVVYALTPWFVRRGNPNRRPFTVRLAEARRMAVRSDDASPADTDRVLQEAIAAVEAKIADDRRSGPKSGLACAVLLAIGLPLWLFAALIFGDLASDIKPGRIAIFIALMMGVSLFGWVWVLEAWKARNLTFADMRHSVVRLDTEIEQFAGKPWSRTIIGSRTSSNAPEHNQ